MNNISAANQEEAANITSEFISSLDNLPAEVQHLLAEIRHRELKSQEIQAEILKESTRYIRYGLKPRESKDGSETPGGTPGASGGSGSNGNGNTKDPQHARRGMINHYYTLLDRLAIEKITLASRLVSVLTRVNARLDIDLKKVIGLGVGGELTVEGLLAGMNSGGLGTSGAGANSMMGEHVEVKNGYVVSVPIPPAVAEISAALAEENGMSLKRRKLTPSAALTRGNSPMGAGGVAGGGRESGGRGHTPLARSRQTAHSQTQHRTSGRRAAAAAAALAAAVEEDDEAEDDEDAEGEDNDGEGEEDDEDDDSGDADKRLYCFCQKLSFGEMVACDNAKCQYQWFHLGCVGLKPPLPDTWICSDCERRMEAGERPQLVVEAAPQSQSTGRGRKGRRK